MKRIHMTKKVQKIAEIDILFVPPIGSLGPIVPKQGERGIRVTLGIDLPIGDYPSQCHIYFDGLWEPKSVCGSEKWQALFLAIELMRRLMLDFQENGWTFELYEQGSESARHQPGEHIPIENLFKGSLAIQ
jgi:hypothetical protein